MFNKTTQELHNEIENIKSFNNYKESNIENFLCDNYANYLNSLLKVRNLKKTDIIRGSNLNRAYVYQIFLGLKTPSRDKVISLSFGFSMSFNETQKFLLQSGYRELYPRDKRDACIIYSINHQYNIMETNQLLYESSFTILN